MFVLSLCAQAAAFTDTESPAQCARPEVVLVSLSGSEVLAPAWSRLDESMVARVQENTSSSAVPDEPGFIIDIFDRLWEPVGAAEVATTSLSSVVTQSPGAGLV